MNYKSFARKTLSVVLSIILMMTMVLPAMADTVKLTDIAGNTYESIIQGFVDKGYVKGNPDGTFRPHNPISRAEFMAIVNRAFAIAETTEISFTDVKTTDWYYSEIGKAVKSGYMQGFAGKMNPKGNISRQELAVVAARLGQLDTKIDAAVLNKLTDAAAIPEWSKGAISASLSKNLFEGFITTEFNPTRNISRLEAVVVLDRLMKSLLVELETEQVAGGAAIVTPVATGSGSGSSGGRSGGNDNDDNGISANQRAANAVIALINTLDSTSRTYASDVTATRTAYNNLTAAQKALVTNLDKLVDAEKLVADRAAAKVVMDMIDALDPNSPTYEDDVVAARAAYGALTGAQKALVTNLNELVEAEEAIEDDEQTVVEAVYGMIDDLDPDSDSYNIDLEAAREAYNNLTAIQELQVDNYHDLKNAEKDAYGKADADKIAADSVSQKIAELNGLSTDAVIAAVRSLYYDLTPDQQDLVDNYEALEDVEAAKVVIDMIDALNPHSGTYAADVAAARTAYDNLTLIQQALVVNYKDLVDAEDELAVIHVPAEVTIALPAGGFTVGEKAEFTVTTTANDDAGKLVIGNSSFAHPEAIATLEYYEVKNNTWYPLSGDFGSSEGFPLANATSRFRISFNTAGDYEFTVNMREAANHDNIVASKTASFAVKPAPAHITNSSATYNAAQRRIALNFMIDKSVDISAASSGDIQISYGTMLNGNFTEAVRSTGVPIVKSKFWSGYLNIGTTKYGSGIQGLTPDYNAAWSNVVPENQMISTTVDPNYATMNYANDAAFFAALNAGQVVVKVNVIDNLGNSTIQYVTATLVEPLHSDATLNDLTVNGNTVASFNSETEEYNVVLPVGTILVPTVVATVKDTGKANAVVTPATALPGTTTVLVTAQNTTTTKTYTIHFTVAQPVQTAAPTITGIVRAGDTSITGTAVPNASIVLSIAGVEHSAIASATGSWTVTSLTLVEGNLISVTAQSAGETVSAAATTTVAAAVIETYTSKQITNLNYATVYTAPAKVVSKPIVTTSFASNHKSFTITDGHGNVIPVNMTWDVNSSEFTKAVIVGSIVDSAIQDWFSAHKGGADGIMNRTIYAASFGGDTFTIAAFNTTETITISGPDASYFFDNLNLGPVSATNPSNAANRTFTISDGSKTATITLNTNYTNIDQLVDAINAKLVVASVKATAQKVDGNHFEIIGQPGIHLTIGGTNKTTFFN